MQKNVSVKMWERDEQKRQGLIELVREVASDAGVPAVQVSIRGQHGGPDVVAPDAEKHAGEFNGYQAGVDFRIDERFVPEVRKGLDNLSNIQYTVEDVKTAG